MLSVVEALTASFGSEEALRITYEVEGEHAPIGRFTSEELCAYESLHPNHALCVTSYLPHGGSAICCTEYARYIRSKLPGRVAVVGFSNEDNPSCAIVRDRLHPGGHDFALVDNRYLVDPWIKLIKQYSERTVFDMADPHDAAEVLRIYGPASSWKNIPD